MKYITKIALGLCSLGLVTASLANEVQYTVNKPMTIVYQVAHQNANQAPVLGPQQTIKVDHTATIPVDLQGYQFAGIVTNSIDGHQLPAAAQQFDHAKSCSVRTDQEQSSGSLFLKEGRHKISCHHS